MKRLNRPFSASVMRLRICRGVPVRSVERRGLLIFTVLAADVGYGLVVESLAEAIGVVAVVGAECVGEGVAFRLEHQACAAVVIEDLIYCGG